MHKLYDDDDELRREFNDMFSDIHASEELRVHTLAQMMENTKTQSKEGKNNLPVARRKWFLAVPAAALLCVALVFVVFKATTETPYLTQLENGVFCEEVELKDGELHFVEGRVAISITPNAGGVTIGQKQEGEVSEAEDSQLLEEKKMANGGQLTYKKIKSVKLPDIGEKNWSYIGKQKIYITVLDTQDTRYQALYEKDGQAYEVTGIGVWQKEFIDYLYQIVRK